MRPHPPNDPQNPGTRVIKQPGTRVANRVRGKITTLSSFGPWPFWSLARLTPLAFDPFVLLPLGSFWPLALLALLALGRFDPFNLSPLALLALCPFGPVGPFVLWP
jgi:hypothetical protein